VAAPSRFSTALTHPLNVMMLAGAGVTAFLTGTWIPLAVAGATELLWLTVGAALPGPRRYHAALLADTASEARAVDTQTQLSKVSEDDRRRYLEVDRMRKDVHRLTGENPSLSMSMMQGELSKVDHLVESFVRIASEAARLDAFLDGTDLDALEAEVRRQRAVVEKTSDDEARRTAADNLALMEARLERVAEMRRRVRHARGQLQLVENTMALIRDQVATMDSPEEISGRLDELVDSVDAIEASAKETEALARPTAQRLIG
jgi:vacuolar-type H+-ATPase subunit I/STV1